MKQLRALTRLYSSHGARTVMTGTTVLAMPHRIKAGQGTDENIVVAGYAKFELMKPPARLFDELQVADVMTRPAICVPAQTNVVDCINLMRTGINMADKVHVVSPTYAREVLLPSDPQLGLIRGEGLEQELGARRAAHAASSAATALGTRETVSLKSRSPRSPPGASRSQPA